MGSLVLTLIISDLILHFGLFIETHSKEFTFNTLELKKAINKSKHFILYCFFPLNTYECLVFCLRQELYNQH